MNKEILIGCDLHNTLLFSNDAWVNAFLLLNKNISKETIKKEIYSKKSRKELAIKYNINYDELLNKYHEENTPNEKLLLFLKQLKEKGFKIVLISSANKEKVYKDLNSIKSYITFEDIYTKENFNKDNSNDWNKIIEKYNSNFMIYIGNDYDEDIIECDRVISIISGHFLKELKMLNMIRKRGINMNNIIMLSGPDKTKYYKKEIVNEIKNCVKNPTNMVVIPADFKNYEKNDRQFNGNESVVGIVKNFKKIFEDLNIELLDNRINKTKGLELLKKADIIFLLGGNPFTQLEYLKNKKYGDIICNTTSLIIGVSAGSMNLAKHAYYSKDEDYPESIIYDGLGIVDITIDPHFDINNKEQVEEIKKNSKNKKIIGLPNDSAIVVKENNVKYIGTIYTYENGILID